jgi:predicted ribosome quality control (RQC) complex YloA/Tae2 family protein
MSAPVRLRVPFDSFVLSAVCSELQPWVGGKLQKVHQPDATTLGLAVYAHQQEAYVLLSCHPQFARIHLATRRLRNPETPLGLCQVLRARCLGGRIAFIRQLDQDRIVHIGIDSEVGAHTLVAELMGKHSNLMLIDPNRRVIAASKWVGGSKSSRAILPGREFEPPPLASRPSILEAKPQDDLSSFEGVSPFLRRWIEAKGEGGLAEVQARLRQGRFDAFVSEGSGVYPLSMSILGLEESVVDSLSIGLERHFAQQEMSQETTQLRGSLLTPLRRVMLAREAALSDLEAAKAQGDRASEFQRQAELILAYGPSAPIGASELDAWDYDGNPVKLKLIPDLSWQENAQKVFDKAKRAKGRLNQVRDQIARLRDDRTLLSDTIQRIETAETRLQLEELKEFAQKRRWLATPSSIAKPKEGSPGAGARIRELLGPSGFLILYGENAESNDYLTMRVAKPNDFWLHVRGGVSAHVVVVTRNQPDRVPKEVLEFAAKVAVQHSPSKHSRYVSVDYTLKKYVRKPKGSPRGTALYTHEKTLNVEGS